MSFTAVTFGSTAKYAAAMSFPDQECHAACARVIDLSRKEQGLPLADAREASSARNIAVLDNEEHAPVSEALQKVRN